jgi:hypothetical protein
MLGLLVGAAGAAGATGQSVFLFRERSVMANFSSEGACIQQQAFVVASESRTRTLPDGTQVTRPSVSISFAAFDNCTGLVLYSGFGESDLINLEILPALGTARLRTTAPSFDAANGALIDMLIDLRWTATGPLGFQHEHTATSLPGVS